MQRGAGCPRSVVVALLLLTVFLGMAGAPGGAEAQIGAGADVAGRCVTTGQTRWVPGPSGRYRETHAYGREEGTWIGALGGVRRGNGGTALFDHQAGRIHVVDDSLRPVARFGRSGEGPGEMRASMIGPWFPRYWSRNPVAIGDSTVAVYDGERAEISRWTAHSGGASAWAAGTPRSRTACATWTC